ncbi:MAG: radical SAM protein [Prevotella sp.]
MSNRIIYQPKGAALEYAKWACNLYNGCNHHCQYCYCKQGAWKNVLGVDAPVLKSQAGRNEEEAYLLFVRELREHREQIIADGDGLFFSFSTDPMLREEIALTMRCVQECIIADVPVTILTKATWWTRCGNEFAADYFRQLVAWRDYVTIGVTLTGHDELEPGAPSNKERIKLLDHLLHCDIRTFVSLEPVVDFESSLKMILDSLHYTAEYRIGLMSPYKKDRYDHDKCERFCKKVTELSRQFGFTVKWKKSIQRFYEEGLPLLNELKRIERENKKAKSDKHK